MAKKIFTIGDVPVFIEAESLTEAMSVFADAIDAIRDEGVDIIYEIESEIKEIPAAQAPMPDKSKLN